MNDLRQKTDFLTELSDKITIIDSLRHKNWFNLVLESNYPYFWAIEGIICPPNKLLVEIY